MFPIIYILYINLINFFWENGQKDIKRQDVFPFCFQAVRLSIKQIFSEISGNLNFFFIYDLQKSVIHALFRNLTG